MDILLLEDDLSLRFTLEQALDMHGHNVTTSANLESARAKLRDNKPELLIFDLMIDGEMSIPVAELAACLLPTVEVIFITGSGMFPRGELYHQSQNVSWVLRKPVDIHELIDLVDHAANTRRERREMSHREAVFGRVMS